MGENRGQSHQLQEPLKILTEVLGQRFSSSQFKVKELDKKSKRKRLYPEGRETTQPVTQPMAQLDHKCPMVQLVAQPNHKKPLSVNNPTQITTSRPKRDTKAPAKLDL